MSEMKPKRHVNTQEAAPILLAEDAVFINKNGAPVLLGSVCKLCSSNMFPAVPVCAVCMSEELELMEMPRTGTLYSFTVVHVGPENITKPFALGYVDLENGVRVFSRLESLKHKIGDAVELSIARIGNDASGVPIETFVFRTRSS